MEHVTDLPAERLTRALTYAGFVLLANELMSSMIVRPIRFFYKDTTFVGGPFKTYEEDVQSRHKNEFEACLFYLRDFLKVIDNDDVEAIQALREHRNTLAHDVSSRLHSLPPADSRSLWIQAERALYRLSQHWTAMELSADPVYSAVDWETVKGHEYLIFEAVVEKVGLLSVGDAEGRQEEDSGSPPSFPLKQFTFKKRREDPEGRT